MYSTRSTTIWRSWDTGATEYIYIMIFHMQNCLGSGATGASLVGSHCARSGSDIGAGNMCLDASTVSEELHVAP